MNAIYGRQSVDRKDSISIEAQIEYCSYETKGEAYRVYVDKGYSGKNTDRPDFQKLLGDIKSGQISNVIVYRLDRISRSILDFAKLMDLFQKYKVGFISATEKFDTSTIIGRAMLNICIVFAQMERETIQKRVIDNYILRMEKGFYMGGRIPYGFRLEETTINGIKSKMYVIHKEESEQIKVMYEMYQNPSVSLGEVSSYIAENYNFGNGKKINRARVGEFFKNPIYVKADQSIYDFYAQHGVNVLNPKSDFIGVNGCYYFKGQETTGRKHVDLTGNNVVIAPHEGFIEPDVWLRCRIKCLNNKQIQPARKAKNTWLAGKVKCGKCGYALTKHIYKDRNAKYYLCSNKMNNKACEGAGTIYAEAFEEMIFAHIQEKLKDFKLLSGSKIPQKNDRERELQKQLSQIETEIQSILKTLSSANSVLINYINEKVTELDAEKQGILDELAKITHNTSVDETKIIEVGNYFDVWQNLTIDEKREICDLFIDVIYATSEEVKIHWKI